MYDTIMKYHLGCPENAIRLVGGTSYREGRLEICQNNEWGNVCNRSWNVSREGAVVCRQLGLSTTGIHTKWNCFILLPWLANCSFLNRCFSIVQLSIWSRSKKDLAK